MSLCKPVEEEHLKINYGDFKRAEEKKRRVTLAAMPSSQSNHHRQSQTSLLDVSVPNDRPDTNTFVANSATLGRKISSMSWAGVSDEKSRFFSLGRNNDSHHHTPRRRKSDHVKPSNNVSQAN